MLSLDPITPTDQKSFDEYIKYFKTKCLGGKSRKMEYILVGKKTGVSLILRVCAMFVGKVTEIVGDFVNC